MSQPLGSPGSGPRLFGHVLGQAYVIALAIERLIPAQAMAVLVIGACWNDGVEAIRGRVAAEVGPRVFSDDAWERGKVEVWWMYAEKRGGVWPTLPKEAS